jgi:histidinol phosphatase-like PHP family hydrolase
MGGLAITPAMLNLHNHTTFSDGSWTVQEILEAAAQSGLKAIGISDHFATSKVHCVEPGELAQYIAAIREAAKPYEGRMRVLAGAEIDSSRERTDFPAMDMKALGALDYALFEYVEDDDVGGMPLWEFLDVRRTVPCKVGLAHNDVGRNFRDFGAGELSEAFVSNGVFMELSTNRAYGRLGKQYYRFWPELFVAHVKAGGALSIGCDIHSKIANVGDVADALEFLDAHGIRHALDGWLRA